MPSLSARAGVYTNPSSDTCAFNRCVLMLISPWRFRPMGNCWAIHRRSSRFYQARFVFAFQGRQRRDLRKMRRKKQREVKRGYQYLYAVENDNKKGVIQS